MTHPADLTASEASLQLRSGRLTAATVVEACLERIAAFDPEFKAFAAFDAELARRHAAAADRSGIKGPLHGLPIAVKDVLDTADFPTSYGTEIWHGHRPRADAAAVALAKGAGAIIIGKTVTTELATRHPGPTVNPMNVAHTPGGSSSGSAAAIAAFMCPLAFGTQTAGSIIRPAAFCGVVGFKPSFGLVNRAGMKVMSESLDTIGVLGRSVADCALLVAAVTRRDLGKPEERRSRPPRIAVTFGPGEEPEPETISLFEAVAEKLGRAGASIRNVDLGIDMARAFDAHADVMNMEIAQAIAWELMDARAKLSSEILDPVDRAAALPPVVLDEGREAFRAARRRFAAFMVDYDIVITPSAAGEAPKGLASTGDARFNSLWSALHAPCVTVPTGVGPRGLPLGVQIVAAVGQDAEALGWARWVQAALT
jgi:Asp-tRNA(Asn)/Glu-tRNA(Gln) amidotransferase A subunit family amidase